MASCRLRQSRVATEGRAEATRQEYIYGESSQKGLLDAERVMRIAPDRTEAAEYYFTYIDKVPEGDICDILEAQSGETLALLQGISDSRSLHRYAAGKWSIREIMSHLNDTERLFVFRALWFARGF